MIEQPSQSTSQVRPVAGGHLRASDADRDQVTEVLSSAFVEGRLSREEYDERLDVLLRSKTFDELVGLTRDLVVVATEPEQVATSPDQPVAPPAVSGAIDRMVGIFGAAERKGKWRIRSRTEAYALFGSVTLDLREAVFESQVVEITGFWCFGSLEVKVPAGVEVRDQTSGIFGGTEIRHLGEPSPGAPVLVLKGTTLFGGVSVKGPRPARSRGATALARKLHGGHGWKWH